MKAFCHAQEPLGKTFEKTGGGAQKQLCRVVGVVADTPYRYLREESRYPQPLCRTAKLDSKKASWRRNRMETFLVRTTASDPMVMAAEMRRKVAAAGAGFRVR